MLFGAGIVVAATVLAVFLVWLAGRGVIPRNRVVGIRLSDVLASDVAWREGHRAAVGPASVGAIGGALVWVVAALASTVSPLIPLIVVIVAVGGLGWAAVAAVHAARLAPASASASAPTDAELDADGDPIRSLASVKITHSGGLIPAAIVSWAPAVILAVYRVWQPVVPATIPSHWTFTGEIDNWVAAIPAFWVCLAVGILSAAAVTAFVVFVGDDIGRFSGSIGLGALTGVAGGFTLTWITAVTAAQNPSTPVSLMLPLALLIGALVFVLATIRRPTGRSIRA